MKRKATPVLQQAGTPMTADRALELIGDDPETLRLAIQLLDRMRARRLSRRRRKKTPTTY